MTVASPRDSCPSDGKCCHASFSRVSRSCPLHLIFSSRIVILCNSCRFFSFPMSHEKPNPELPVGARSCVCRWIGCSFGRIPSVLLVVFGKHWPQQDKAGRIDPLFFLGSRQAACRRLRWMDWNNRFCGLDQPPSTRILHRLCIGTSDFFSYKQSETTTTTIAICSSLT